MAGNTLLWCDLSAGLVASWSWPHVLPLRSAPQQGVWCRFSVLSNRASGAGRPLRAPVPVARAAGIRGASGSAAQVSEVSDGRVSSTERRRLSSLGAWSRLTMRLSHQSVPFSRTSAVCLDALCLCFLVGEV